MHEGSCTKLLFLYLVASSDEILSKKGKAHKKKTKWIQMDISSIPNRRFLSTLLTRKIGERGTRGACDTDLV